MDLFDFIADDTFRDCVASDYRELLAAQAAGAWKSVVVMAGSIVEAVLVDYLLSSGACGKTEDQLLKMELGPLIELCKNDGVLSERTTQLSTVIKNYRNLIHAARVKRLGEKVNEESANIAESLLKMVIDEVSAKQIEAYGHTAEQVVAKIFKDQNGFLSVFPSLLPRVHAKEKRKLLLNLLPFHYDSLNDEFSSLTATNTATNTCLLKTWTAKHYCVIECYRLTHASCEESLKAEAVNAYLQILKFGDENKRRNYEHAFFRAAHLRYANDPIAKRTIISHLFSMMESSFDDTMVRCTSGVAAFVDADNQDEHLVRARILTAAKMVTRMFATHDEMIRDWAIAFSRDLDLSRRKTFIDKLLDNAKQLKLLGDNEVSDKLEQLCQMQMYIK